MGVVFFLYIGKLETLIDNVSCMIYYDNFYEMI